MSKPAKTFIAITSEALDNKLVHLTTSTGESLTDVNGINYKAALDFLFGLIHKRKRQGGIVFCCYAFQRDNEFIFSTLPREIKDKLFQSHKIKKQINQIEFELENITDDYYKYPLDSDEFQLADFEKHVNQAALDELTTVEVDGYTLELANGKVLTIRKGGKAISIYDIFGFFKPSSLYESVRMFCKERQPLLDRRVFDSLDFFEGETEIDRIKNHAFLEVSYIAKLATVLNENLISCNINLSRFHGASAITSYIFARSKAKKQYHNYRHRRQLAPPLHLALRQSVYGGRAEQFKIGTLYNVNVYDINSAYAHAATQLPVMLSKPRAVNDWNNAPFSFWFCEYDFTKTDLYFGLLPNRELTNFTKYKLKGSGYFWQPEITYVMRHYPECIKIGRGYVLDGERADFTREIQALYDLRLELQQKKNPTEKILKLALSSIYGKFCQHNGKGHYYNLFYAAYITSVTRAQLLEATKDDTRATICFQTDAIHTTKKLSLPLSSAIGEYKHSQYDKVVYLDNGVYQCYRNNRPVKTKTRGFRRFDFAKALIELKEKRSYTALAEFFVGHNLFSKNLFTGADYLSDFGAPKTMYPAEKDHLSMRVFKAADVDLTKTFLDSVPVTGYTGLPSAPYRLGDNKAVDLNLDTLEAGRI